MRLHVIDGTYELFRAHHSRRPARTDPEGHDVKATVGVLESLLALLHDRDVGVTHVAAAFDNPIESFRNELYAGYKTSAGVDPALLAQFDLVEEAVAAGGITVWSMRDHEADDALATAAARLGGDGVEVVIVSPDKDLGQAVRDGASIQWDRRTDAWFDERGVRDRLGVAPASVPDWLALVGDDADGIPGIKGFGRRTATVLLERYGHLHAVPPDGADWDVDVRGATQLAARLQAQMDDALLYRRLATLVTDLPLAQDLDALAWAGVHRHDFGAVCERLGATRLADRDWRRV